MFNLILIQLLFFLRGAVEMLHTLKIEKKIFGLEIGRN